MIKKLLLSLSFLFLFSLNAWATTYTLKASGGDYSTITQVNAASFSPDDILVIDNGYSPLGQLTNSNSGTVNHPITYKAIGNYNLPIITGCSITGASYITYNNIKFLGTSSIQPLDVLGCDNLIFDGIEVDGQGIMDTILWQQTRFTLNGTTPCHDITIRNSTIHSGGNYITTLNGGGISIREGSYNFLVENNTVYDEVEHGMQCYSNNGSYPVHDIVFRGNTIYMNSGYTTDMRGINAGFTSYNITIERNYIKNCPTFLIGSDANTHDVTIKNNKLQWDWETPEWFGIYVLSLSGGNNINTKIYNNTIIDNSTGATGHGVLFLTKDGTTSSGHEIKNNIFYTRSSNFQFITEWSETTRVSFTSDYNCFYQVGDWVPGVIGTWYIDNNGATNLYATLAEWRAASGKDANSIDTNPKFVSSTDFSLQTSSPCKDTGETIAAVANDYLGRSRPQGSAYDIGAYEYVSPGHYLMIKK
jgi:hypothetical protein